jgi:hypothetical protein
LRYLNKKSSRNLPQNVAETVIAEVKAADEAKKAAKK